MKFELENGVKEQLQDKLIDYLKRQGIEVATNGSQKFSCINPKHSDSSPSANIIPGTSEREWKCHGCGCHGDIFTAVHYLEDKPLDGPGFIEENLMYLANHYHVKVPVAEMTEEEARRWKARRAYRIAVQFMADCYNQGKYSEKWHEEINRRKWKADRIIDFGVGQIPSYQEFYEFMIKQDGFDTQFLVEIDLFGRRGEWMFAEDKVLFVLQDVHGRPCGFAARNLSYIKHAEDGTKEPFGPKYKNSKSAGLYEKKKVVYNIHEAKKYHEETIFILEGYADVVASRLAGYDNVVAIGGTSLTDEHVMLLRQLSCNSLVIAMDGDETGTAKTGDLIEKLGEFPGITVEVLRLPPNAEEKDVDGYIRKNGEKAWGEAQQATITAFQWTLQNRPHDEDKYRTLERAVKAIVPISFPAQVYRMCDELGKELDIPLEIVREEVKVRKDSDKAKQEAELIAFGETVQQQIKRRPGDIRSIVSHANNFIGTIDKKSKLNPIDPADQIAKLSSHVKREDETSDSKGIIMGWPEFDSKMYGIPPNDTWIVLGGKANAGKTSMCANMIYNGIRNNEDLIAVVYTIDDSYSRFMPRMVSLHAGIRTSWVSKRKVVEQTHPGIIRKVKESYKYFADLMRAGRLYVWDIRDGNTWAFANAQLARLRQENPKAKILMVLDNFHLLQDFTGDSTTQNYSRLSNMVANTVKEQEIALISTVEYHKLKKRVRPENQSIHYTQQLEYDSHLMLHLVNYQDEFESKNKLYWESKKAEDQKIVKGTDNIPRQVGYRKPITEVIVGKSKLEEFKGNIFFRFDPARCLFTECDEKEMARCRVDGPDQLWIQNKNG